MSHSFKSKRQFAGELGVSESTLHRRLKLLHIPTTGRLLSPLEQNIIRLALGFPPPVTFPAVGREVPAPGMHDRF